MFFSSLQHFLCHRLVCAVERSARRPRPLPSHGQQVSGCRTRFTARVLLSPLLGEGVGDTGLILCASLHLRPGEPHPVTGGRPTPGG